MRIPELLAPAGNLEKLRVALAYGADAVYFGGKSFGLRAFSDNFGDEELAAAVAVAHEAGKKAYVTVNIFPHNEDLPALPVYIALLRDIGADAVIVSDPGVYRIVRQVAPELPIHISTQANTTNWSAALFWQELGARRIVLAREVSLADVRLIRERTAIELEAFVHGAMCISYSGRCLLSNYFTGRDANRGECAQACRWRYHVVEETRPGQYFPVTEDERGTYLFNSRDLCLLPHIPAMIDSGLSSFKIEGRMKSVHYVATVVKVYREALDAYAADPRRYDVREEWLAELAAISHRPYTTGFAFGKTGPGDQLYGGGTYKQSHDFVGLVRGYDPVRGLAAVEQRNNMKVGEEIEVLLPQGKSFRQHIDAMFDAEGNPIEVAPHPQQLVYIPAERPVVEFAMLRRKGRGDV
ncbi:peptidase U32 family protein [Anaeroselena agilis]|uniref:U32 family peptidase n=1 Tax=Anaeroselena agilis TaxID=3063788 RepID=A0ABU3NW54_9FIRM|nr:U32 family peptidase [Selenomonadales bacterium 4137-cl]